MEFICMDFGEWFSSTYAMITIAFAVLGVSLAWLSKRITRAVRKTDNISDKDNVLLTLRTIACMFLFASMFFAILASGAIKL
jgi:hypothetical protein